MRDLYALILADFPVKRTSSSGWAIAAITLGLISAFGLSLKPAHAQSIPVLPPVTPENLDAEDLLQNEADQADEALLEDADADLGAPEDANPEDTVPEDTVLEDTTPEDTTPELLDLDATDAETQDTDEPSDSSDGPGASESDASESDASEPSEPDASEPSASDAETVIPDPEGDDRPNADDLLLDDDAVIPAVPDAGEVSETEPLEGIPLETETDVEPDIEPELEGGEPELDSDFNPEIFELEIEVDDPADEVPGIEPPAAPPAAPSSATPPTAPAPSGTFKPSRGTTIFENVVLSPSAMANPTTIRGISGGPLTASRVAGRTDTATGICTGFVDRQPDHRIELTEFFDYLSLQVESPEDTVLVVRGPGGSWCNDDVLGFNPGLAGEWFSGVYDVWVGSYNEETYHPYIIRLTDIQ